MLPARTLNMHCDTGLIRNVAHQTSNTDVYLCMLCYYCSHSQMLADMLNAEGSDARLMALNSK